MYVQLGFAATSRAIDQSLRDLQAPFIHMYLIHWPT